MIPNHVPPLSRLTQVFLLLGLTGFATASFAQAPIVQPGMPGDDARELSADEAIELADTSYSEADVVFMQDMIPHHHQAIQMAELVSDRTNLPDLVDIAGRIDASQADEIEFMQGWLRERGEDVPEPTEHDAMHTTHQMAGMASPAQMAELAAAEGTDFDRLFQQLMIAHHEGANHLGVAVREPVADAAAPVVADEDAVFAAESCN